MSTNDITNDEIKTGVTSDAYAKGYDLIFGKKVKPTVEYEDCLTIVEEGFGAILYAPKHPRYANRPEETDRVIKTSRVIRFDSESDEIETENTLYVKAKPNA